MPVPGRVPHGCAVSPHRVQHVGGAEDVCNGCGACVAGCPFGVIERRNDSGWWSRDHGAPAMPDTVKVRGRHRPEVRAPALPGPQ
ncbi:4Fe-4S binding protein [Kocuria rhizophila]|nr:4Fe-4S binding protein [Kocuria rhizophila]